MEYKKYIDKELQTEETTMRGGATEIIEVLKYLSGSNRNLGSYTVNLKANTAGVKEALAELEERMQNLSKKIDEHEAGDIPTVSEAEDIIDEMRQRIRACGREKFKWFGGDIDT